MPRSVDFEQRRSELIEVTAREIARVGLERLTLRDIARAGGWTTGIVSHYFVDKRDLVIATFRSRANSARTCIAEEVAAGATPLSAIIDCALPLDEERLANWKVWLAFWGSAVGDDDLTRIQVERHQSFVGAIEQALQVEQDAGRLEFVDLALEARRLVALLDGIAAQAVFQPDQWPPEEQRRLVDAHLAVLRARDTAACGMGTA